VGEEARKFYSKSARVSRELLPKLGSGATGTLARHSKVVGSWLAGWLTGSASQDICPSFFFYSNFILHFTDRRQLEFGWCSITFFLLLR